MKTIVTYKTATTKTGTKAIIININDKIYQIVLSTDDLKIIAILKEYQNLTECDDFDISGTETGKYFQVIKKNLENYNCLFNERCEFFENISLAIKMQEGKFFYDYPIYKFLETLENPTKWEFKNIISDYFKLLKDKNDLQKRFKTLQKYGTLDAKKIKKIDLENEKTAKRIEKARLRERKQRELEVKKILLSKLKDGYNFLAVMRIWGGAKKHLKFQGTTIEFRTEKPRTRNFRELTKATLNECINFYLLHND